MVLICYVVCICSFLSLFTDCGLIGFWVLCLCCLYCCVGWFVGICDCWIDCCLWVFGLWLAYLCWCFVVLGLGCCWELVLGGWDCVSFGYVGFDCSFLFVSLCLLWYCVLVLSGIWLLIWGC